MFDEVKEKVEDKKEKVKNEVKELNEKENKFEEKVDEKKEEVENKIDDVEKKVDEKIEKVEKKVDEVQKKAEEKIEEASQKVDEAQSKVKEKKEEVKAKADEVEKKFEEGVDQVENKIDEAGEKINETTEKVDEKIEETEKKMDEVQNKTKETKEKVNKSVDKANSAVDKVEDKTGVDLGGAKKAVGKVGDVANKTADKVDEKVEAAKAMVGDLKAQYEAKKKEADDLKEKIKKSIASYEKQAKDLKDNVMKKFDEKEEEVEDMVDKYQSIGRTKSIKAVKEVGNLLKQDLAKVKEIKNKIMEEIEKLKAMLAKLEQELIDFKNKILALFNIETELNLPSLGLGLGGNSAEADKSAMIKESITVYIKSILSFVEPVFEFNYKDQIKNINEYCKKNTSDSPFKFIFAESAIFAFKEDKLDAICTGETFEKDMLIDLEFTFEEINSMLGEFSFAEDANFTYVSNLSSIGSNKEFSNAIIGKYFNSEYSIEQVNKLVEDINGEESEEKFTIKFFMKSEEDTETAEESETPTLEKLQEELQELKDENFNVYVQKYLENIKNYFGSQSEAQEYIQNFDEVLDEWMELVDKGTEAGKEWIKKVEMLYYYLSKFKKLGLDETEENFPVLDRLNRALSGFHVQLQKFYNFQLFKSENDSNFIFTATDYVMDSAEKIIYSFVDAERNVEKYLALKENKKSKREIWKEWSGV